VVDKLTDLGVADAASSIRAGTLTSESLVEACLARIADHDDLNAFITLRADACRAEAREADRRAAEGRFAGPLHGVPLVVKDSIHVAGCPNTAGTPGLAGFVPTESAPVVQRLVDAGAVVLGKTNMHELAFGITSNNAAFGPVRNAYDRSRVAGGSSGGTAAAIAARLSPGGLGTDTGGSVRIPAALNGIAGLRPTTGRYPGQGITPISATRDTAGPMARSVADLALLDGVLAGGEPSLHPVDLRGLRLGKPSSPFFDGLDSELADLTHRALERLRGVGVELIDVVMPGLVELNEAVSSPLARFEARRDLTGYLAHHKIGKTLEKLVAEIASPDVKAVFEDSVVAGAPHGVSASEHARALTVERPALQRLYAATFAAHGIEVLVFPVVPAPAPPIGAERTFVLGDREVPTFPTMIRNTDPGSNAGVPGLVLPVGRTEAGLPVAIELDGPPGSERRLLAIGLALEAVLGRLDAPP
jgi:mandelamide amidase